MGASSARYASSRSITPLKGRLCAVEIVGSLLGLGQFNQGAQLVVDQAEPP